MRTTGLLALPLMLFLVLGQAPPLAAQGSTPKALDLYEDARQTIERLSGLQGAASGTALLAMVDKIAAYKTEVDAMKETNPGRGAARNRLDQLVERATGVVMMSITGATQHGKTAKGAKDAVDRMVAKGLLDQKTGTALKNLAMSSGSKPATHDNTTKNNKNWAQEQSKNFARNAGLDPDEVFKKANRPQSKDKEVNELETEADELHKSLRHAKSLPSDFAQRFNRLKQKVEAVKTSIDALKKGGEKAKDALQSKAADATPALIKAGVVVYEAVSLIKDWNKLSDVKKIRDVTKLLADGLEVAQLALAAAVPEKLVVVAVLRVLAELLDFGIASFGGDGGGGGGDSQDKGGGSDGQAPGKDKNGGGGQEPYVRKPPTDEPDRSTLGYSQVSVEAPSDARSMTKEDVEAWKKETAGKVKEQLKDKLKEGLDGHAQAVAAAAAAALEAHKADADPEALKQAIRAAVEQAVRAIPPTRPQGN
jgi:hypothetical protein